jgi:hypothetical protein
VIISFPHEDRVLVVHWLLQGFTFVIINHHVYFVLQIMILLVISASNIMIHDRRKKEEEVKKKKEEDSRKLMWGFGYCAANQNYQRLMGQFEPKLLKYLIPSL